MSFTEIKAEELKENYTADKYVFDNKNLMTRRIKSWHLKK